MRRNALHRVAEAPDIKEKCDKYKIFINTEDRIISSPFGVSLLNPYMESAKIRAEINKHVNMAMMQSKAFENVATEREMKDLYKPLF